MKKKIKGLSLLDDLKNIRTSDNKRIRKGVLYRSSNFAKLEDGDEEKLIKYYNLHYVVDFRTEEEATKMVELADSKINRYWFPMLESHENRMITKENRMPILKEMSKQPGGAKQSMIVYYSLLITSKKAQKAYKDFFDTLLKINENEALAFHCTQGKDRTGVALMLLLSVLGVEKKTIIKKYLQYNKIKFHFRFWAFVGMTLFISPRLARHLDKILGARKEYIASSYQTIEKEYQNIDNYISNVIGLSENDIKKLRLKYLH